MSDILLYVRVFQFPRLDKYKISGNNKGKDPFVFFCLYDKFDKSNNFALAQEQNANEKIFHA